MRHLCVYKLLQLLMFIREFRDMSLYGHRPASLLKGHEIKSLIASFVTPSLLSKGCEALTGLPGERGPGLFRKRLAKPSPHLTTPITTRAPEDAAASDAMTDEEEQALRARLAQLRQEHGDLDAAIAAMTASSTCDQLQLTRLKKRKLQLKDQIARIEDSLLPDITA
jgi:hypothetical protein